MANAVSHSHSSPHSAEAFWAVLHSSPHSAEAFWAVLRAFTEIDWLVGAGNYKVGEHDGHPARILGMDVPIVEFLGRSCSAATTSAGNFATAC